MAHGSVPETALMRTRAVKCETRCTIYVGIGMHHELTSLHRPLRLFAPFPPPPPPPVAFDGVLVPDTELAAGAGSASAPPASIFEILHLLGDLLPGFLSSKGTYEPIKSMFCIPCIFFLVSATSLAISGSISKLAYDEISCTLQAYSDAEAYTAGTSGEKDEKNTP